jgi:hypothetical protein
MLQALLARVLAGRGILGDSVGGGVSSGDAVADEDMEGVLQRLMEQYVPCTLHSPQCTVFISIAVITINSEMIINELPVVLSLIEHKSCSNPNPSV